MKGRTEIQQPEKHKEANANFFYIKKQKKIKKVFTFVSIWKKYKGKSEK